MENILVMLRKYAETPNCIMHLYSCCNRKNTNVQLPMTYNNSIQ